MLNIFKYSAKECCVKHSIYSHTYIQSILVPESTEPCSSMLWIPPRMQTPQALWDTSDSLQTLQDKCVFLLLSRIFCFSVYPLPFFLVYWAPLIIDLPSFPPPFRYLYELIRSILNLQFSRPSSLSLSLHKRSSSTLIRFVACLWTFSSMPRSLLCWGGDTVLWMWP